MRLVVAILIVLAGAASAEPFDRKAAAREVYTEGSTLYTAHDYLGAAAKFEAAYQLEPDPALLFNIAQAYRLAKSCARAAAAYRSFLEAVPSAPNRDKVQGYITELDACEHHDEPAHDDRLAEPRVITVTKVIHDSPPRDRKRIAGIAIGAAGLVVIAAGVYFSFDVGSITDERANLCANGCTWSSVQGEAAQLDHRGQTAERAEVIAYSIGVAALASGGLLYWLGRDRTTEAAAVPTKGGAMVSARWRF